MAQRKTATANNCFVCPDISDEVRHIVREECCFKLPANHRHESQYYCVLHLPDDKKHETTNFRAVVNERLKNQENDFRWTYFSETVDFERHQFLTVAHFGGAKFKKDAFFGYVTFKDNVYFSVCTFEENTLVRFLNTVFKRKVDFSYSKFYGDVYFEDTLFKDVFEGEQVSLNLQYSVVNKESKVLFKHVRLRPNWFINVDCKYMIFEGVRWENIDYRDGYIFTELESIRSRGNVAGVFAKLLSIACRRLASNAEENSLYEEASKFRLMAMEASYHEKVGELVLRGVKMPYVFYRYHHKDWKRTYKRWRRRFSQGLSLREAVDPPLFFYRTLSLYGESWIRAAIIFLSLILIIFPLIYVKLDFVSCSKDRNIAASLAVCEAKDEEANSNCSCTQGRIEFRDAIVQSLTTATLQNVEYRRPLTYRGEIWILLEKIFVPLQAALLALALRRKFMRQ